MIPLKVTPEIIQKILELHSAGNNPNQIAIQTGLSAPTVKVYVRQAGLVPNKRHEAEQAENNAKFLALVRSGVDWRKAKDQCGIYYARAKDIMTKAGVPFERKNAIAGMGKKHALKASKIPKYSESLIGLVKQLKTDGYTIDEIVLRSGVNRSTVKKITLEAGILISKDEMQRRAQAAKFNSNPNHMQDMRKTLTQDVIDRRSKSTRNAYRNNEKLSLAAAVRSKHMWERMDPEVKKSFVTKRSELSREVKLGMTVEAYEAMVTGFAEKVKKGEGDFTNMARLHSLDPCTVLRCAHRLGFSDLVKVIESHGQKELLTFVKEISGDMMVRYNARDIISPLELDIYVPQKGFAIEYNGLYWHSEASPSYRKGKEREKYLKCLAQQISLLVIYDDEWSDPRKREIIKDMIRYRMGVSVMKKIRASDLTLEVKSKAAELDTFFNDNHLDGSVSAASVRVLKTNDGETLAAISIRRTRDGILEIARFASKRGVMIHGALAKLISGINEDLVSFSNNRIGSGNVYGKCGFEEITQTEGASYFYTDFKLRIRREKCMRLNPPEISQETFDRYPTEAQQAHSGVFSEIIFGDSRPLYRIEDCGHRKWLRKPTPYPKRTTIKQGETNE